MFNKCKDLGFCLFQGYFLSKPKIITGKKPNEKFLEYAQMVGMIVLLGLLLFANGNDIYRHFIK